MDQSNCSEDAEDFSKLKKTYFFNKKCKREIRETIELLKETSENYQESLISSHLRIKHTLDEISTNCNSVQYASLKVNFHNLQTQFTALLEKYEHLQSSHNIEIEAIKEDYLLKCREYEEKIAKLKEEIDIKEEEYLQDLHTTQAESAFKFEEMESNLQKLLDTSNKKVRELNQSNSVLRSELMTIKNSFTIEHSMKIRELESKLLISENRLKMAQANLLQVSSSSVPKYSQPQLNLQSNKNSHHDDIASYIPKAAIQDVENGTHTITENSFIDVDKAAVNLYKETKKKFWNRKKNLEPTEKLPQLQFSNMPPISNNTQVKRRKLYSLDDVEHLERPD